MTEDELIRRFPRLYHMAEDGAWPAIAAHGLLSAAALCDLYGLAGPERDRVLRQRRPRAVALVRAGLAGAVLRDQGPLNERKLAACLDDGLTAGQWHDILNARVFFWLDHDRLARLLGARAYRARSHLVLTVDTSRLLAGYRARVTLSSINSGSTLFVPPRRGLATFQRLIDLPTGATPVELTVQDGVPDIIDLVLGAERWVGGAPAKEHRRE